MLLIPEAGICSVVPGPRRGRGGEPGRRTRERSSRLECTSSARDCPPRAARALRREPGTAAWAMAAADTPSATLRHHDLCSRGIRLARKMRSDVTDLLDIYVSSPCARGRECRREAASVRLLRVGCWRSPLSRHPSQLSVPQVERQGLDASISVAAVDGVPTAAVERWAEQTGTQRLLDNLAAYRAFRTLLAQMLEEQRELLGDTDAELGPALAAMLLQVSAFVYHLEELLELESRGAPAEEGSEPPAPPRLSLFEQKLRGLRVLRELAQWAVRSVRDLRQLSKHGPGSGAALGLPESQ